MENGIQRLRRQRKRHAGNWSSFAKKLSQSFLANIVDEWDVLDERSIKLSLHSFMLLHLAFFKICSNCPTRLRTCHLMCPVMIPQEDEWSCGHRLIIYVQTLLRQGIGLITADGWAKHMDAFPFENMAISGKTLEVLCRQSQQASVKSQPTPMKSEHRKRVIRMDLSPASSKAASTKTSSLTKSDRPVPSMPADSTAKAPGAMTSGPSKSERSMPSIPADSTANGPVSGLMKSERPGSSTPAVSTSQTPAAKISGPTQAQKPVPSIPADSTANGPVSGLMKSERPGSSTPAVSTSQTPAAKISGPTQAQKPVPSIPADSTASDSTVNSSMKGDPANAPSEARPTTDGTTEIEPAKKKRRTISDELENVDLSCAEGMDLQDALGACIAKIQSQRQSNLKLSKKKQRGKKILRKAGLDFNFHFQKRHGCRLESGHWDNFLFAVNDIRTPEDEQDVGELPEECETVLGCQKCRSLLTDFKIVEVRDKLAEEEDAARFKINKNLSPASQDSPAASSHSNSPSNPSPGASQEDPGDQTGKRKRAGRPKKGESPEFNVLDFLAAHRAGMYKVLTREEACCPTCHMWICVGLCTLYYNVLH